MIPWVTKAYSNIHVFISTFQKQKLAAKSKYLQLYWYNSLIWFSFIPKNNDIHLFKFIESTWIKIIIHSRLLKSNKDDQINIENLNVRNNHASGFVTPTTLKLLNWTCTEIWIEANLQIWTSKQHTKMEN
jgi:hypothetical protein